MTNAPNPFTPMLITFNPDRVYGRENEITSILQVITSPEPNSHAIYGIRTIGKTTLLKYLKDPDGAFRHYEDFMSTEYRPGGSRQLHFVYINFSRFEEDDKLFSVILEHLLHDLTEGELLTDLDAQQVDDTAVSRQDIVKAMRTILSDIDKEGIRIVFLLDEFDAPLKFVDDDDDRLLRTLSNQAALIIATEKPISQLRPDFGASSPLLGILRPEFIDLLSYSDSRMLISNPLQGTGIEFSTAEQDFLIAIAGRQPFMLTAACELYFDMRREYPDIANMLDEDNDRQNLGNQFRSRLEELPHINSVLSKMWEALDEHEQTTLYDVTLSKGARETSNKRSKTAKLANKSLAYLDLRHGVYHVFSLLFASFIKRQYMDRKRSAIAYPEHVLENLTPIDRALFEYLLQHTDNICTFDELRETVWGDSGKSKRALEAAVHRLRKIMREDDKIKSIRGKGYKFVPGSANVDEE